MEQPTVFIFSNGNIAITDEHGQQLPELQESIVQTVCERLKKAGYDPTDFEFQFQSKGLAKVFLTECGKWNWSFRG